MTVRPATLDDLEEILRLARLMFASIGVDAEAPEWQDEAREAVAQRLDGRVAIFVVDRTDGAGLVASGAGSIVERLPTPMVSSGRVGYVQWVATDVDARRRGHGRAVMAALLAWFDQRQVTRVELHATDMGTPLYGSLGFTLPARPVLQRDAPRYQA